ncbi:MAG: UDP-N-acetylmuramoyl-tripeptide--D-alanyl-D-alanine ligase [bacterium]|nr:UDP-N-acetylmuramoyl-tripeptide--D-alanyl-D-alanine ligase [bacterium]
MIFNSLYPSTRKPFGVHRGMNGFLGLSVRGFGPLVKRLRRSSESPYHKLQRLAAKYYLLFFPGIEIIGVTGSVGKTTTKEAIATVLAEKFRVVKSKENIDPIYNIPLTIFKINPRTEKLVLEMGVDHPGDMDKYLRMAKPKIVVVTKISPAHTEFLKDIEGIVEEKGKILECLSEKDWAVLNADGPFIESLAKKTKAKIFYYGLSGKKAFLTAEKIQCSLERTSFILKLAKNPWFLEQDPGSISVDFNLVGRHQVYSALAAAGVSLICGLGLSEIKKGLEKIKPSPGRMNIVKLPGSVIAIDDSYNASPAALEALLDFVGECDFSGRKIAVLGEMKELGKLTEAMHRKIGGLVAAKKIDYLFTLGETAKFLIEGAVDNGLPKKNTRWFDDMVEAAEEIKKLAKPGSLIFLKGSRFAHMERVLESLRGEEVSCRKITCRRYLSCLGCETPGKGL